MSDSPRFAFAGGGTGGHLFPGIAVAEELRARLPDAAICFVGSERDVERRILSGAGFDRVALPSPPSTWIRRRPLRFALRYWRSRRAARALLGDLRPDAVIGLGGFASLPVVTAAARRGIPIVLLEQNAVAGRATQWLSRYATTVCHSFNAAVPTGRRGANAIVTGNPVRRSVAELAVQIANSETRCGRASSGTISAAPTLLVLGGSQGSTAVNEAVRRCAGPLRSALAGWRVVHQCGAHDAGPLTAEYARLEIGHEVAQFFADLPQRYAQADVVVSRAGATTLAELACAGLPAVLVPYPNSVRDHQRRNAEVFAAAAAAATVDQQRDPGRTARLLADALRPLLSDPSAREQRSRAMRTLARPHAARNVADAILGACGMPAETGVVSFAGIGVATASRPVRVRYD